MIRPSDLPIPLLILFHPYLKTLASLPTQEMAYFNSTNFYAKGNQSVCFSATQHTSTKSMFSLAGFPLIQFFELATFVMLGIFVRERFLNLFRFWLVAGGVVARYCPTRRKNGLIQPPTITQKSSHCLKDKLTLAM